MTADDLPHTYDELNAWIMAHPGRFTYVAPGPGGYMGTRFVKQVLYHVSGGYEQWIGDWDEALYAEWAPQLWEYLNAWEPNLWRGGETYPANEIELAQLFANNEIDFALTQATAGAGAFITAGLIPETSRAFSFDEYSIGDYNYVAIPANATHKAAALVLADLLLRPDRQAGHIRPETGFGLGYAVDINRVGAEDRLILEAAFAELGDGAADPGALAEAFVPDMAPESQSVIEADWEVNVLRR
jgi:putative spermidine/putrescine transport system substrate-binding protein